MVKMRAKRMIIIQIIGAAHLSKVLWFWQCWYLEQWQARVRQISKVLWDSLLRLPARATSHMIPNISNMILNHIFSSFIIHIPCVINQKYHWNSLKGFPPRSHLWWYLRMIRLSLIGFRLVDYFSEKNIAGPHGVPGPPSLAQMTFTQCTSMSELEIDPGAPPGGQI